MLKAHKKIQAKKAGLYYVNDFDVGYQRKKQGEKFIYFNACNKIVTMSRIIKRIEALVIPPAWQKVWICPKANGHIQATGFDEKKRKQYIYHASWTNVSEALKFERLLAFYAVLPSIRRRVAKDLAKKRLTKTKVIAAVIKTIDKSHIRVGCDQHLQQTGSRGATTLAEDNVTINGLAVQLHFQGKSGIKQDHDFKDKKVVKVIRACQELDAQFLFSYRDKQGEIQAVDSTQVNDYLREHSQAQITAKDFRTWWANVHYLEHYMAMYIASESKKPLKKWLTSSIKFASQKLGHTPTICRNSYLHPGLLSACEGGAIIAWLDTLQRKKTLSKNYLIQSEQNLYHILLNLSG